MTIKSSCLMCSSEASVFPYALTLRWCDAKRKKERSIGDDESSLHTSKERQMKCTAWTIESEGSTSLTIINLIRKQWHANRRRKNSTDQHGKEKQKKRSKLLHQTWSGDNWYRLLESNCISYSNSRLSFLYVWMCVDFVHEQFDLFIIYCLSLRTCTCLQERLRGDDFSNAIRTQRRYVVGLTLYATI